MKLSYLIKVTPFLSTLLLIIFLGVNNQKEYTKIRLLIWSTPSLTLGNYLAISTGTGFILSYFITTKLGNLIQKKQTKPLEFKDKDISEDSLNSKEEVFNSNHSYENTLIERDINDPSPTINASFRIIGKTQRSSFNRKASHNDDEQYERSFEFEEDLNEQSLKNDNNRENSIKSDWSDDTYSVW